MGKVVAFPTKPVIFAVLILAVVILGVLFDLRSLIHQALLWIDSLGSLGPACFILLYILMTVFLLPGSLLTIASGFVFGFLWGLLYASIASTLGAASAFFIGRYAARSWVKEKIAHSPTFSAVDAAITRDGWIIVGLLRLSPIMPFNLSNYFFGITGVSAMGYILASWICMLPGTVLYVYIGSLTSDLALIGQADKGDSYLGWAHIVGLLATIVLSFFIVRIARKAIRARIKATSENI